MRVTDKRKLKQPPKDGIVSRDHCDKCHVAKAKVIGFKGDFSIALCGHHARKYGPILIADGWTIREVVSA